VVVSCGSDEEKRVCRIASQYGVPCTRIGTVTNGESPLEIETRSSTLRLHLDMLRDRYFGTIPGIMSE